MTAGDPGYGHAGARTRLERGFCVGRPKVVGCGELVNAMLTDHAR
ncbi:MAG TPA: hypothetical protein VF788_17920 [Pseudonocardiaceae bacterium]